MPTKFPEIFAALAAPFAANEVKTRPGGQGRQLSYVTARTVQNRFDEVVGPENWKLRYRTEMFKDVPALVCTILLRIDGEWIDKEDAGGFKEMTEKSRSGETVEDEENTVKTGYSDSFKRSGVVWGVARYLYKDGPPRYREGPDSPAKAATNGAARATPARPAEPTPAPPKAPRKDARTYWQWVTDATNKRNERRGESNSPNDVHWMLVVIASNEGLCSIEHADMVEGPLAAMNEVHATDPTWVIRPLMRFVEGKLNPFKIDNLFRFEREDFPLDPSKVSWDVFLKSETSDCGRGFAGEAQNFIAERTKLLGTDSNWKDTMARRKMLDALRDYVASHPCSLLPEGAGE